MGHGHDHHHHHHHHLPETEGDQNDARYRESRNVTLIGSVIDLLLGVAKIVVGYIGSSQALIADGVHSLSDLATDGVVLLAMKHGSREADEEHPYGHGRIETLATIALGVALIGVAAGIAWDAVVRMLHPELLMHPGWLALIVATISIIGKEAIYQYTMHVANKWKSNLLRANAWHSRSDAISSVVVAIGVLGSMGGLNYLDAVAAIGVALMVAKIGIDLSWHSAQELIDTAMEPEQVEQIRQSIHSVDGVQALHMLRTRRMGDSGLVDVHIMVNPRISVSEGHRISDTVRAQIMRDVDNVTDVMVHIDPEDDEIAAPSTGLPLREEVLARLKQQWADIEAAQHIEETVLHYLDGKIHVEVLLPLARMGDLAAAQAAAQQLSQQVTGQPGTDYIAEVQVRFH
jgi:cation diffusion facilitator family transporter